MKSITIK